jgi:hypothetical protein
MESIEIGRRVLMPCEVKPGPFSDERLVRVHVDHVDWLGFVPVGALREPVVFGSTYVSAFVTGVSGDRFTARVPGHGLRSNELCGSVSRLVRL